MIVVGFRHIAQVIHHDHGTQRGLGEAGYEAMTTDAVAARAHASKTTIYRRWPGKPALVRAAVDAHLAGRLLRAADTGRLRGDLFAVMRAMPGHLTDEFLALMSGLTHALRQDPELAQVLTGGAVDDAFAEHVVDDLVLPVLDHGRQGG